MGLWHFLVTSAENPGDDFGMRLRKGVVGCLFFPVFFAVIGYAIRGYIVYSVPSHFAAAGACTGMGLVSAISFGWMRHTRDVSDRHVDAVLWGLAGFVTIAYLCFPEFDNKTCVFACATMGILAQMPTFRVYAIFLTLQCLLVDWNNAMIRYPDYQLTLPEPRRNISATLRLVGFLLGSSVLFGCVRMFYVQVKELQRQQAAQLAATQMTMRVLKHQRKYDTEEVGEILSQCAKEQVVDPELIALFKAMNSNLESYRPFLPNYLFLEGGHDVMSLLSDVPDDPLYQSLLDEVQDEVREAPGLESAEDATSTERATQELIDSATHHTTSDSETDERRVSSQFSAYSPESRYSSTPQPIRTSGPVAGMAGSDPMVAHYTGQIAQAFVELQCSSWFSTHLVHQPDSNHHGNAGGSPVRYRGANLRFQCRNLTTFTDTLFDLAQTTKASVHSLIGDSIQLTWNATHRVAQPGLKAATFLLRFKEALEKELPHVAVAGAACSGLAEVHSTVSLGTRQRAMYIDAPWLPALEACHLLAKRHRTLVVDANTEAVAHYDVVAQGIDCLRYVPRVALIEGTADPAIRELEPGASAFPNLDPKGFPQAAPDTFDSLLGLQGPQQEEAAQTFLEPKPLHYTIAYELIKRKEQPADDEWMYQLQAAQTGGKYHRDEELAAAVTKTLFLVIAHRVGEAAIFLTENNLDGLGRGGATSGIATPNFPASPVRPAVEIFDPVAAAVHAAAASGSGPQGNNRAYNEPNRLLQRLTKFCQRV